MKEKIWLSPPHMGGNEQKYIEEAFATNWISSVGPNIGALEEELAERFHGTQVAALASGTSAIHLALALLGVGRGDHVIVSTFTFSASANPVRYLGAQPIFVESEAKTWNMSPEYLEEAILDCHKKNIKPKALVLVHLYGMPSQMGRITEICARYDLPLIEDAAEALGSLYKGKPLGTFGEIGILSFNGNKIITGSSGGALLSSRQEHVDKARFLATQARDPAPHYEHSHIGYNYRMSNIIAGIVRGQLEVLDERIAARRKVYAFYEQRFRTHPHLRFLDEPEQYFSNRWLSTVLIDDGQADPQAGREALRHALEMENIESRPLWKPMHKQPIFQDCPYVGDGLSERLFDQGLCLPSGSSLQEHELERIASIMEQAL